MLIAPSLKAEAIRERGGSMSEILIRTGILLHDFIMNDDYRVIDVSNMEASLIKTKQNGNTLRKKLVLSRIDVKTLIFYIENGQYEIVTEKYIDFDETDLPDEERERFNKSREFLNGVNRIFGPTYLDLMGKHSKPEYDQLVAESGLSHAAARMLVIRYLQSGLKEVSILQNYRLIAKEAKKKPVYTKKTGRPPRKKYGINGEELTEEGKILDEKDYANFEKYTAKYLRSRVSSKEDAYADMIINEYSDFVEIEKGSVIRVEKPRNERPTKRQFFYHIETHTTLEQRLIAKEKEVNVRNNRRVFRGSVMDNVFGPGDLVEIDAHEIQVSSVAKDDREKTVGRAIVYFMIDVFTRLILAFSVSFENNSVIGLINCFLNLIEDKEALYRKLKGTAFKPDNGYSMDEIWPSCIKPAKIRYDHGSDFISNELERILQEQNMQGHLVPPASGSFKPVAERGFGSMETTFKMPFEKYGLIRKDYDSKHHQTATVDIDEMYEAVFDYVLFHNTSKIKGYTLSPDMKKKGVLPIPCELWKYGVKNIGNPERIIDRDLFLYKLMQPVPEKKVTISRQGIVYRNLHYFNNEDLMDLKFRLQNKRQAFQCRIDPRDCGHIYYMNNGLKAAYLNPNDPNARGYIGMPWKEFDELSINDQKNADTAAEIREVNRRILAEQINDIVKEAKKKKKKAGHSDTKNMRENRKKEKLKTTASQSAANRFDIHPEDENPEVVYEMPADEVKDIDVPVYDNETDALEYMKQNSMSMFDD